MRRNAELEQLSVESQIMFLNKKSFILMKLSKYEERNCSFQIFEG